MKSRFELFLAYKRLWAVLVILAAILFFLKFMSDQSAAQSPSAAPQRERVLESLIKKEVPMKVNIKKEKEQSFKDLTNEKWVREFELEVTNTGDKPIYFLYLTLITDVKVGGSPLVFPLTYGRKELGGIKTKATLADEAIKPGETYAFKIHPGQVPAWERDVSNKNQEDATRLRLKLEILSFGDGTGFLGNHEYPSPTNRQSDTKHFKWPLAREENQTTDRHGQPPSAQLTTILKVDEPAILKPAKFLYTDPPVLSSPLADTSLDAGCDFECVGIDNVPPENVCYNCPLQNRPGIDSSGTCSTLVYGTVKCNLPNGDSYLCQTIAVYDCGDEPFPTPTPSPTPSPAPCEYCADPNAHPACNPP